MLYNRGRVPPTRDRHSTKMVVKSPVLTTSNTTHTVSNMEDPVIFDQNNLPAAFNKYNKDDNSDVYLKLKKSEKELELLLLQEDYIKDEQRHLKR